MTVMDVSGTLSLWPRRPRIRLVAPSARRTISYPLWEDRCKYVPTPGTIRLLYPAPPICFDPFLWAKDYTLTEWIHKINLSNNENPLQPPDYAEKLTSLFETNQRRRWLARIVYQRWTQHIWRKRTQCNVDMIDMQPVKDTDAIFLTDTTHRTVFRFHKNDIRKSIMSNLSLSDEMLPTPRYPTNPWTNSPLTTAQAIGLCQQLAVDYGRRGTLPPVLFAAFWESRFDLKRLQEEFASLLAQLAVMAYFKELHEYNQLTVFETITTLLSNANLDYSPFAIRKWLRQTPQTQLHKDWLKLARDYTLYINLHVQNRPNWYSEEYIYADVRRLYARTVLPDGNSQRMRLLREPLPLSVYGITALPSILQMYQDPSGSLTEALALELIRTAFYG